MKTDTHTFVYALAAVIILACVHSIHTETQTIWPFDSDKEGQVPKGWEVAEANGKGTPASWEVTQDASAPSGPNVVAITYNRNPEQAANLLLNKTTSLKNIELSVRIKTGARGRLSGGGMVWRAVDENHYYLARWNPSEGHVRLYLVVGGKSSLLESASVEAEAEAWHQIEVIHNEAELGILFDGESVIEIEEKKMNFGGWIGLWAPGDATPSFDDVSVYSEEEGDG